MAIFFPKGEEKCDQFLCFIFMYFCNSIYKRECQLQQVLCNLPFTTNGNWLVVSHCHAYHLNYLPGGIGLQYNNVEQSCKDNKNN